jgi:hypothetical protein
MAINVVPLDVAIGLVTIKMIAYNVINRPIKSKFLINFAPFHSYIQDGLTSFSFIKKKVPLIDE